jgi:H+/Cl- antiporter ClcA
MYVSEGTTTAIHRHRLWLLSLATGVVGGVVGAIYLGLLHLAQRLLGPGAWSDGAHIVVLVSVGIVITVLTKVLGSPGDVELLVDNIHVLGGNDDTRGLRSLIPISLLGIGAGSTLGPEAPLVQTTGTLGTWLGRRAGATTDEVRVVTITGMAAGFSVLFGAPLGAAFFALEILHRRGLEYYEALMPSMVGALCGYAMSIELQRAGVRPVWDLGHAASLHPVDLLWALGIGVAGAALTYVFSWTSVGAGGVIRRLPFWSRPALGGLMLGLAALITPYALTNGEIDIQHLVHAPLVVKTLVLAVVAKFVLSAVLGSFGWRGGFIIPLFFVGYGLGELVHHLVPGTNRIALIAAFMVAINVGVTKTPVGTTLVVTEMAGLAILPSTIIAAVTTMLLTSGQGLLHSQRPRGGPTDIPERSSTWPTT